MLLMLNACGWVWVGGSVSGCCVGCVGVAVVCVGGGGTQNSKNDVLGVTVKMGVPGGT